MEFDELRLLDALVYLQGFMACVVFVVLDLVGSTYGRYSSHWHGRQLPARPAWFLQELPSMVWPLYECLRPAATRLVELPNRVLLAMFLIHYVQRTLVFPFLIRGGKPTPLFSFVAAVLFCTVNGYMQSRYLSQFAVYAEGWETHPYFLMGFALWLAGMVINIHSDYILRNLRKPGETGYKIPRGGLFEYVSAANYFGEVVEWCGFALASWSLQGAVFALFTFFVLFTRAKQHHQWYHEKFEDYPKSRKILIPFVL
ncbi:3-oxo-5-alpha-steroid 4-dehydrogenase 1 [Meriones unguiculatus]|uniref:3-oxo-5-alpha-steroid 4-dehydrogenase 1 n=1 Tax=Meriones unguiculatus TaxID=10047 RepID=UPI000B4EFC9A|nr:3-oxo-5-alpha-steroid 4-dehydrogenase 1 [Meriones unguiculatus]